jgi:release factor glutamine methyltransferase
MSAARAVPGLKAGVSVAEARRLMIQTFRLAGIESPESDARALVGAGLHLTRAQLVSQSDRILEAREASLTAALAARRLKREPVSRILGEKEFWSLPLRVTPDVLDPRPETETLVEAALDEVDRLGLRAEKLKILDIGTGTGALPIALLTELPQAAGLATDISSAAIAIARENAERHKLVARCGYVVCNVADAIGGQFDLIVSNPPYIARGAIAALEPEVRDFDPKLALDGGADGLDAYRAIAAAAPGLFRPGGRLIVELGIGQDGPVRALMTAGGLEVTAIRPDLAGIPRALIARLPK